MGFKLDIIATLISVVAGLLGIWALRAQHPILAYLALLSICLSIVWFLFFRQYFSFLILRRGISKIIQILNDKDIRPEIIISFDRTGGALASMVAVNLGVQEILILNRHRRKKDNISRGDNVKIGIGVKLDSQIFKGKKIVIVEFYVGIGSTLEAGITYLKNQSITQQFPIIALYITPVGKIRWSEIDYVYVVAEFEKIFNSLPWVLKKYHLV